MPFYSQTDWTPIRQEYISNPVINAQNLARKFGVTPNAIRLQCHRHAWNVDRAKYQADFAQRLNEMTMREDAPKLLRQLNAEWLEQSRKLKALLNEKLNKPDVKDDFVVRAVGGFVELYRMDRLAVGASTDNLAPALLENKYDSMSEEELQSELEQLRRRDGWTPPAVQ